MKMQERMKDPVMAADGRTYERYAIEDWCTLEATSPATGEPMASKLLTPNLAVKAIISTCVDNAL